MVHECNMQLQCLTSMQHTVLCAKRNLPYIKLSYENSSKIIQSMYAMNPDVYTVSSQDFVGSIATNLYGACKLHVVVHHHFHGTYSTVCQKHLPNVIPSVQNSSKIVQSTYAINPDV